MNGACNAGEHDALARAQARPVTPASARAPAVPGRRRRSARGGCSGITAYGIMLTARFDGEGDAGAPAWSESISVRNAAVIAGPPTPTCQLGVAAILGHGWCRNAGDVPGKNMRRRARIVWCAGRTRQFSGN
jgi:hypothetical protein